MKVNECCTGVISFHDRTRGNVVGRDYFALTLLLVKFTGGFMCLRCRITCSPAIKKQNKKTSKYGKRGIYC